MKEAKSQPVSGSGLQVVSFTVRSCNGFLPKM